MTQTTFALILFLIPLAWSPGPGNLFFAANGARFGVRSTLALSLGYHAATFAICLLIGLGFAASLIDHPRALATLRVFGAAYILWLAFSFLRGETAPRAAQARPAGFVSGVLLLTLNPKAYMIMLLMLTQFSSRFALPPAQAALWITTIFTLNNLVAFTTWTWAGGRLSRRFQDPKHALWLNRTFAALLAATALWMLLP